MDPAALPRPALWPAPDRGRPAVPYLGRADAGAGDRRPSTRTLVLTWTAVAVMILGAVLFGLGIAVPSWLLAGLGAVVGLAGSALALRTGIMDEVEE